VWILIGILAAMTLLAPEMLPPVWAALGQPAATVERDRVVMRGQGQRQRGGGPGFSIDTITVAGMEIKEYVSPDGVVFVVVWRGTGMPDLQLLLGEYYEEYREGLQTAKNRRPRIKEPFRMKSDRLVVERAGHSRSLWGRAYLPIHLPPGIRPEDIQ
jgi:Protein of unknown function (DUF2844)